MAELSFSDVNSGSDLPSESDSRGELSLADVGVGHYVKPPSLMERLKTAAMAPATGETARAIQNNPVTKWAQTTDQRLAQLGKSAVTHPIETLKGIGKGAASALVGTAEAIPEGLAGLAGVVGGWIDKKAFGVDDGNAGVNAVEATQKAFERIHKATVAVTKVNLTPHGEDQAAFGELLSSLPEAATALGDDAYEKTGSAALATAYQVGGNALMFLAPAKAAKTIEPIREATVAEAAGKPTRPVANKQASAFDDLAATNEDAAQELAQHVAKADPELGSILTERADAAAKAGPKATGKKSAKTDLASKIQVVEGYRKRVEPTPEETAAGVASADTPTVEVPVLKPEQIGESLASTTADGYKALEEPTKPGVVDTPEPSSNEIKAGEPMAPRAMPDEAPIVQRSKGFSDGVSADAGVYTVQVSGRTDPYRIYRDPESGWWYEDVPGHHSRNVLGFTKKEAVDAVANRDKSLPKASTGWDKVEGEDGGEGLHQEWVDLHQKMMEKQDDQPTSAWSQIYRAKAKGQTLSTHKLLDHMVDVADDGTAVKQVLVQLRKHVPDADIIPKERMGTVEGIDYNHAVGLFDSKGNIHVKVPESGVTSLHTRVIIHEAVHAATVDFMEKYPTHPLVKEAHALFTLTKERMRKLETEAEANGLNLMGGMERHVPDAKVGERVVEQAWGSLYGTHDPFEMIAEAHANPDFQRLLIRSEKFATKWDQLKDVVQKLAFKIAEMLGIKRPSEAKLLHNILTNSEQIMKAQARDKTYVRRTAHAMEDPTVYEQDGAKVTKGEIEGAFRIGDALNKVPGVELAHGKLEGYFEGAIRTVNPEGLGKDAKLAAAILARNVAVEMARSIQFAEKAKVRRDYWNHHPEEAQDFIRRFEKGEKFDDPILNKAATAYKNWNAAIYLRDSQLGMTYETVDNYLYHVFEDGEEVARHFEGLYGSKWGDPKFTKDRSFDLYEQAIKAGFKPKYTNPEDIMLARQHASDVSETRIQTLNELEAAGLAKKVGKGEKSLPPAGAVKWRSPNGDKFLVADHANAVLHNYFNTKSLWSMQGFWGDAFRGSMFLKNLMVPIKLGLSLFHPVHVATIDNVTAMVRASKELLSGKMNPLTWMSKMASASLYLDFFNNPIAGGRIRRAYMGKLKEGELTAADKESLLRMTEGGMTPTLSEEFKTRATQSFRDALARHSLTAIWRAPFAALDMIRKPLFDVWIPNLKIASYLKDVQTAIKTDPELLSNWQKRRLAFRKIAKSVDNRYGEMAYNTLFMNKMVKDVLVANTLSLGWQMGFIREYGGGALDIGQAVRKGDSLTQKAKEGMLDRPMFLMYYTTSAMVLGGMITWALTGQSPSSLMDYIYPKTGDKDAQGNDKRVSTPFYTREFMSVSKHIQTQGVGGGIAGLVESKSSGLLGMFNEWAQGVNSFGEEIRDPNAPLYKQVEQTLASTLSDMEPISLEATRREGVGLLTKTGALSFAGFTPAPKYVAEPRTEAAIKATYMKYYAGRETPYEKAETSKVTKELRAAHDAHDYEKASQIRARMLTDYDLTPKEVRRIEDQVKKGSDPLLRMFSRLSRKQQDRIMQDMTPEELKKFKPHANKELRHKSYEEVMQE